MARTDKKQSASAASVTTASPGSPVGLTAAGFAVATRGTAASGGRPGRQLGAGCGRVLRTGDVLTGGGPLLVMGMRGVVSDGITGGVAVGGYILAVVIGDIP